MFSINILKSIICILLNININSQVFNSVQHLHCQRVSLCVCYFSLDSDWPISFPDLDANYGGGLLDMVKGGAGKFFSNFKDNLKDTLKDTSTKVMHQVAT